MHSKSQPLVSVILPCYNSQKWVGEAIESCLRQTYDFVEVIVVDDGSTDQSLEIIRSFEGRIRWQTGPNRGGNVARNVGLSLARGTLIQFLDADDLLDTKKIEYQAPVLVAGKADVVFGEWAHLFERNSGDFRAGDTQKPKISSDPLSSLIRSESWAPNFCHLYRRDWLERINGWNESLRCMQDVDLNLRLICAGARYEVIPGFCGFYRRPRQLTVSTRNPREFFRNCMKNYQRSEEYFHQTGWTKDKREALAAGYHSAARFYALRDSQLLAECLEKIQQFDPRFRPDGPRFRRWMKIFGYRNTLLMMAAVHVFKNFLQTFVK